MASTGTGGGNRLWAPKPGRGNAPHRPTIVSSVVTALIAVGVVLLFVLIRNPSVPTGQSAPPTTAIGSPTTPPITGTLAPATTVAPGGSSTDSAPEPCTALDVRVVTTTDKRYYLPGAHVSITTVLRALHRCAWGPVPAAPHGCAITVSVVDALGNAVWPAPGQSETCTTPASTVLRPGDTESVRTAWNGQVSSPAGSSPAPPGPYRAVGAWTWNAGTGQAAAEVTAPSSPFTVG